MAHVSIFSSSCSLLLPYHLHTQFRHVLGRVSQLHDMTNAVHSSEVSRLQIFSRGDWNQRSAKLQQVAYASGELVIVPEHYCSLPFQRDLLLNMAGSSQQPIRVQGMPKPIQSG